MNFQHPMKKYIIHNHLDKAPPVDPPSHETVRLVWLLKYLHHEPAASLCTTFAFAFALRQMVEKVPGDAKNGPDEAA
jgi:hypothetical protein